MTRTDFIRQLPSTGQIQQTIWQRLHLDPLLFLLLTLLGAYGLFVLYSAADDHVFAMEKQGSFFAIGFVVMLAVAHIDQSTWRLLAPVIYTVGVIFLIAVAAFGETSMGAQRWLAIPGLPRFQPSEILKIGLPMMLATYFHNRSLPPRFSHIVLSLAMIGLPVALIVRQPDLGTGMLVLASGIIVLFMAGLGWGYILTAMAAAAAMGPVMWLFVMHDYQRNRILMLFDPESDKLGAGWNIIQSQTAIGSGGWAGKGWQMGTQSQLDFLPEGHTDFVFAVYAEDWGFVGVLVLLALFIALIWESLENAARAKDTLGALLAAGIVAMLCFCVVVNIGMTAGMFPIVGIPLPLVSYGGSATIMTMASLGLLLNVKRRRLKLFY